MTINQTTNHFNEIAWQALSEYDLPGYHLVFLRHSDNVTFRAEKPGSDSYLLRIHVPITTAMGTHGTDPAMIQSELLWLEALSQDTDLVLQKPVRNKAGELVTRISVDKSQTPVNCTLLNWLPGQPYQRQLETESTAAQIGVMLAKMHQHASQWMIPRGFTRPWRDYPYFESMLSNLRPAVRDGRISPGDFAEYETSIEMLADVCLYTKNQQRYMIIHADTHKGNMLIDDGKIRLIDFSFCSRGDFLYDLAICLSDMKKELHSTFMQSYHVLQNLPEGYPRLIEAYFMGSIVGAFAYWVSNPNAQELLARKVPQIAREYAVKFNRGEPFWFS